MIEVLDIKDAEPNKLDITPELALAAYNTLIQFCKQQEGMILCSRCVLHNSCPAITDRAPAPEEWEEIHYPRMTSNTTIEYLKDGKVQLITYGRSEDAEKGILMHRTEKQSTSAFLRAMLNVWQPMKIW